MILIRLKECAREKKNWSLYRLAKEIKTAEQTVYSWAHGRTQPSYEGMNKICSALECQLNDWLVYVKDSNV